MPAKYSLFRISLILLLGLAFVRSTSAPAFAWQDAAAPVPTEAAKTPEPAPAKTPEGHSYHGEVFNEGPRQAAYLMPGMGNVHFAITTTSPMAQRFMNQGVAQLHGFWYFEAERSFRQAAAFDSQCAMAYWGMAMANLQNEDRARKFVEKAMALKDKIDKREKMHIEALDKRLKKGPDGKETPKKDRLEAYVKDLERIIYDYPDDIETLSMLALHIWDNDRNEVRIQSHIAVDAILEQIFRANPRHPAHHYRIHLWDYQKTERALKSAAAGGPSLPGVAHMWHMPGHIYSRLHRYEDAAWQQEASARVDHAYMIRDHIMPDQIHNYAHNNEWLIRDLNFVGRVRDALDLAKNMIELPRHPKNNNFANRGSASYGRERLIDTLTNYRLWDELLQLADTVYLEPTKDEDRQDERLALIAVAGWLSNHPDKAQPAHTELEQRLAAAEQKSRDLTQQLKTFIKSGDNKAKRPPQLDKLPGLAADGQPPKAADLSPYQEPEEAADKDSVEIKEADGMTEEQKTQVRDRTKVRSRIRKIQSHIAWSSAAKLAGEGNFVKALQVGKKAGRSLSEMLKLEWQPDNKKNDTLKQIDKKINESPGEAIPLAVGAFLAWKYQDRDLAKKRIEALASIVAHGNKDTPLLARLTPIIAELGLTETWNAVPPPASDLGDRPNLDTLGPFRWSPSAAPFWVLPDTTDQPRSLKEYRGKPLIMIFYLGFGCLHCVEQIKAFTPKIEELRKAGFEVVAVSTEKPNVLQAGFKAYDQPIPFPLLANPDLDVFRSYRCFDDFEGQPLHGTFIIDRQGEVVWQDIGFEPFKDVDFLLEEGTRLLNIPRP